MKMNWTRKELDAMELTRMDAILASEEAIAPSSGFLAAVMEQVQEEARTPAPIPFPWKRAVPGFVLAAAVFGWGAVELVQMSVPAMEEISFAAPRLPVAMTLPLQQAGWVALALGISLASWLLARRFAGRSALL
jgi:hypothetical protein